MSGLPRGWAWTTLGEIGDYMNGRGFRKSEWSDAGRPIIRIQNLTGTGSQFNYYDGEAEEPYIARRGDVLVSWAATLGVFVWGGPEAVVNQHIFKVRSYVDARFHRYLIASVLDELRLQTHGSGMVHITRRKFDETRVAIPPLAEQRRIVAAIEEQLSRLEAALGMVAGALDRLQTLRTAATVRALSGDWPLVRLADVTADQMYGTSAKASENLSDGVPVLRMGNIADGQLDLSNLKYLPRDHPEIERHLLHLGDLLFNRTNSPELVGKAAIYKGEPQPAIPASYLIRVRLTSECDPNWASLVINSPLGRRYIASVRTQQVGQANVNGAKLAALPLPLPPCGEQRRILDGLDIELDRALHLELALRDIQKRARALRLAIFARAFRGELVPQNPDDEPASVLLERIAAQRAAAGNGRRPDPSRRHRKVGREP